MKSNDLQSKPVLLTILLLAWPTMLEQILQTAVQYIDSAMVGRLGAEATAAVGCTATVGWMIGSSISALGVGFLAYIARAWGAKRYGDAARAVSQVVLATLVCGVVFTVIPLSIAKYVPVWMNADPAIRSTASRYFFILYSPMIMRTALILFGMSLRAIGDTKTPMRVNVLMNVINVVLNYLFIYQSHEVSLLGLRFNVWGAGLGVEGAALASAISFAVGGVAITAAVWRHPVISPKGRSIKPDAEVLRPCLVVAVPSAAQRFLTSFGYVAFASLINGLGTIAIAAHSIANTVESAFYVPGYGMQAAASTLSGNTYGAGDQQRMRSITRTLLILEVSVMCVSGALLFLFAEKLMWLFTISEETVALGTRVLRMVAVSEPIYGVAIILEGIFQGVGDTRGPFAINVLGMWGFRILGSFLLLRVFGLGLEAAWACMILHNVFLGVMFTIRYKRGTWNPLLRQAH
ncbi:MAG: MATE family efflux transporter [Eubacteriales bacterium]|nr:MATE family efflux transporter [Eubacteriales bacterium]